jgi:hypothetical protein
MDTEDRELEMLYLAFDLEQEWKKTLPKFTNKELLEIFPEAKGVIPEKIAEWEEKVKALFEVVKKKLTIIKLKSAPENQWFWRELVKLIDGTRLLEAEGQINRLKGFLLVSKGYKAKGWVDKSTIQQVLAVSFETLLNQPLRRSGKTFTGLCPLHNEKHPSFCVYPETNSFYCYGCNQGGDVIKFTRLLYGFNFKQAVEFLLKK